MANAPLSRKTVTTHLLQLLDQKMASARQQIDSLKESRESDDNSSSAGDKYETGVEMIQQEIEQAQERVEILNKQITEVHRAKAQSGESPVSFGNLVTTSHGQFFLAVGLGEVKMDGGACFCISTESPLGQALMGKAENDEVTYGTLTHRILNIG